MAHPDLFREAVKAARAGERLRARDLLLELVEGEPRNEMAWLWLSELVDDPEDKIIALENVLTINPGRPLARQRLEQLREQRTQAAPQQSQRDLYAEARAAVKGGRRQEGRDLLRQLVAREPDHERAWLALSRLVDGIEEQMIALENVLRLNPNNDQAQIRLTQLQLTHDDHLALGRAYEERGQLEKAITAYRLAEKQSPSAADRVIAGKRRQAAEQLRKQGQPVQVTHPTTTLLRLAAGPVVMYGLLLFIHSGLNPLRTSPILCLGGLGVALGSLLIAGVHNTPHHALWKNVLGADGLRDAPTRLLLSVLGLLFLAIPFAIILINAVNRLAHYQTTFSVN